MCQILFAEKRNPPMEVLEFANEKNADGFGFAWAEGGAVSWDKGYTKDKFEEGVAAFLDKPFPKAIHFRLATHGGVTPELTHPFPIKRGNPLTLKGTAKSVLFHNGVWASWDDRIREAIFGGTINPNILREMMSDSRAMAILCQRFGPDILDVLDLHSNKVLVLMHNTWYRYGDWKREEEGWSASNSCIFRPATMGTTHGRRGMGREAGLVVGGSSSFESTSEQKSLYLAADREEVEEHIQRWGIHA